MLILLEGIDKTGKSTLAKKISKALEFKIVHFGPPKTNDYYTEYIDFLLKNDNVICDRSPLGQFVYGPILRNEQNDKEKYYNIINLLKRKRAIVIYTNTNKSEIRRKFTEDHEHMVSSSRIDELNLGYKNLFDFNFPLPLLKYNYLIDNVDFLLKTLKCINNVPDKKINFPYLGPQNPKVLLIGEKFNKLSKQRKNTLPFDFGISSKLLKETIPLTSDVGYINAFSGHHDVLEMVLTLNPYIIITLGQKSARRIKECELIYVEMEHPAYISRFPDKNKRIPINSWKRKLLNLITSTR